LRALLLCPVALEAVAMIVDELWFHRRRGLPRWERIGHPVDTASVALTYAWALCNLPTGGGLAGYIALATLSSLLVTKDEPMHRRLCTAGETWLHALLFVLHPVVFLCFGLLWQSGERTLLGLQLAATVAFGMYQLVYWSVIWKPAR
jgi:biotin transporter BioY